MRKITKITNGLGDYDPVPERPSGLNKKIGSTNLCEVPHGRSSRVPVPLSVPVPDQVLSLGLGSPLSAPDPDSAPGPTAVQGLAPDPVLSPRGWQLAPDPNFLTGKAARHGRLPLYLKI
jgi:hypothetical protein